MAVRLFSDSDGSSYGDMGYHLSFSNHRINLQSNKNVAGRTIREALGSSLVDQLAGAKFANFEITTHRKKKIFVVSINGIESIRWHDPDPDFFPSEDGVLFINQGGNSAIRLQELSIVGWNGEFFPHPDPPTSDQSQSPVIVFKNGDSSPLEKFSSTDQNFTLQSKHGAFCVPIDRVQSLAFAQSPENRIEDNASAQSKAAGDAKCEVFFGNAEGKLTLELVKIKNQRLQIRHPALGEIFIPLHLIHKINASLGLKQIHQHLEILESAHLAVQELKPYKAISILDRAKTDLRGWYWQRLFRLAQNLKMEELLSFQPFLGKSLLDAKWGPSSDSLLLSSREGELCLYDSVSEKKIFSENRKLQDPAEFKRERNEGLRMISLNYPFWMSKTEITRKCFSRQLDPSKAQTERSSLPIEVQWEDAIRFCSVLNKKYPPPQNYSWRLPTEAEWEYACRAGSEGPYCRSTGSMLLQNSASHEEHLGKFAWFQSNANGSVKPVGLKSPNDWGLHDMHGNLAEWCIDAATHNKLSFLTDRKPGLANPVSKTGEWRVLRGGSFVSRHQSCRSAYRDAQSIRDEESTAGMRVVLAPLLEGQKRFVEFDRDQIADAIFRAEIPMIPLEAGKFMMGSMENEYAPEAVIGPEGKFIYSTSGNRILLRDQIKNSPQTTLFESKARITRIQVSQNGEFLFAGCEDGSIYVHDLGNEAMHGVYTDHSEIIVSLAIDSKVTQLVSACLGGAIVMRNLAKKEPEWSLSAEDYPDFIDHLEFSPDSSKILGCGKYSSVRVFDRTNGNGQMICDKSDQLSLKAHWHPNGRFIFILHPGGILTQLESKQGIVYRRIDLQIPSAIDFEISPDGKKIAIISEKGWCSLRNLPIDDSLLILHANGDFERSPDFYFRMARQNDPPVEKKLWSFRQKHGDPRAGARGIAHSPDGRWTVTSLDGKLRIWDRKNENFFKNLSGGLFSPFHDCFFSPDGRFIAGKLKSRDLLVFPCGPIETIDTENFRRSAARFFN